MIEVHFLIPVWGRHEALKLCLQSFERIKREYPLFGVNAFATVICSTKEDVSVCKKYPVSILKYPNDQGLGRKFNAGLDYLYGLGIGERDYIVPLGSDDIINTYAIHWVLPYLIEGVAFFGISNPAFYNLETGEAVYYKYKIGSGAFRFHRAGPLAAVSWNEQEQRYVLWPDEIGFGMDIKSEETIMRGGYSVLDITPKTGTPLILDIKDSGSLSAWKNLVDSGHKRIGWRDLVRWFPEVGRIKR